MSESEVVAAFDPELSSAAAVASKLSLSAQYQVVGFGELRTWSGPGPGERLLLAASQGAPRVGDVLTLRLALPAGATKTPLSWALEGLEPLEPLPETSSAGAVQVRVWVSRARGRSARVQVEPKILLELALIDS